MSSAALDSAITQDDHGAARGCLHPLVMPWLDRVHHGDNCEVLASMPAESVDLVVTSPPYDDLRTYGGHSWDFAGVARELTRVLKPGGVIVWVVADATINGSETLTSMRQAIHFKDVCGLNVHDTMIWNKGGFSAVGALAVRYAPVFEYMFVFSKGFPKRFNPIKDKKTVHGGKQVSGTIRQADGTTKPMSKTMIVNEYAQRFNVWEIGPERQSGEAHPAPFPLAKDHVESWSNPGDVVLDPFAGSGTTLRAAKDLNRHYIGIEINEDYLRIINQRLAQDVLALA